MVNRQRKEILQIFLFYLVTLMVVILLAGLFLPSASLIRELNRGEYSISLLPLSFLLISFIYGFIRARGYIKDLKITLAYGWLMGSAMLITILLYLYLEQLTRNT